MSTLITRCIVGVSSPTSLITDVHIPLTTDEPHVDSYASTLGIYPSNLATLQELGTYEQCYSCPQRCARASSIGLFPRVYDIPHIPVNSCYSRCFTLSGSSAHSCSTLGESPMKEALSHHYSWLFLAIPALLLSNPGHIPA